MKHATIARHDPLSAGGTPMSSHTDIAFFVPSLCYGGAERVVLVLANEMARRGFSIEVVTALDLGPYAAELRSEVRTVCLRAPSMARSLAPLTRYLRRSRPAAMICVLNRANVIGLAARWLAKVDLPIVVSERSNLSAGTPFDGGKFANVLPTLMRYTYPNADAIVAVSQGVADDLAQCLHIAREKISVIHNPIDFGLISSLSEIDPHHPWLTVKTRPVILSVGRLHPAKDYPTLVKAFALLRRRQPCRLIIVGDGEERAALEQLIRSCGLTSDDVDLPGFARNPFAFMKRADVFALSSRFEGFPNALVEAMACGARVVSTDCRSGPSEILENGRWGRLVETENAHDLSEALAAALNDTAPLDVIGRARQFSVQASADAYLGSLGVQLEPR